MVWAGFSAGYSSYYQVEDGPYADTSCWFLSAIRVIEPIAYSAFSSFRVLDFVSFGSLHFLKCYLYFWTWMKYAVAIDRWNMQLLLIDKKKDGLVQPFVGLSLAHSIIETVYFFLANFKSYQNLVFHTLINLVICFGIHLC